jgi:hypothetical protein
MARKRHSDEDILKLLREIDTSVLLRTTTLMDTAPTPSRTVTDMKGTLRRASMKV